MNTFHACVTYDTMMQGFKFDLAPHFEAKRCRFTCGIQSWHCKREPKRKNFATNGLQRRLGVDMAFTVPFKYFQVSNGLRRQTCEIAAVPIFWVQSLWLHKLLLAAKVKSHAARAISKSLPPGWDVEAPLVSQTRGRWNLHVHLILIIWCIYIHSTPGVHIHISYHMNFHLKVQHSEFSTTSGCWHFFLLRSEAPKHVSHLNVERAISPKPRFRYFARRPC